MGISPVIRLTGVFLLRWADKHRLLPSARLKLTSLIALTPPKDLVRFFTKRRCLCLLLPYALLSILFSVFSVLRSLRKAFENSNHPFGRKDNNQEEKNADNQQISLRYAA